MASVLVAVNRPKTAPLSLLVLYCSLLISQTILLAEVRHPVQSQEVPAILKLFAPLAAIIIILNMPLRNPELSNKEISSAFELPSLELRSPEDNLTPLQYMTVSWMTPLIKLGAARQLNEQDIWNLGYEFQHSRLHDAFRSLHGSVLWRLLKANGFDLALTTFLGILELCASMKMPFNFFTASCM